jgi:hypothetical protein
VVNDEQLLRERLGEIDVPPMGLGMDQVVAAGFRRVRRRRIATVAGTAALTLAVLAVTPALLPADREPDGKVPAGPVLATKAPSMEAAPSCTPALKLPVPKGAGPIDLVAVDPTGRHIVGNGSKGQDFVPFAWNDGKVDRIKPFAASVEMFDVNSSGTALGRASDGKGGLETFFRYRHGKVTPLSMPAGRWQTNGWPQINTAGDIIATAQPADSSAGRGAVILLWPAGKTTPEKLPLPKDAAADDLADNGTIVGILRDRSNDTSVAYVWDRTGRGRALETPPGVSSGAYAISRNGAWATGGLWPEHQDPSAALWNVATGKLVARFGQQPAQRINSDGLVITMDGALFRDGKPVTLVSGATSQPGVTAVADTGLVTGTTAHNYQC